MKKYHVLFLCFSTLIHGGILFLVIFNYSKSLTFTHVHPVNISAMLFIPATEPISEDIVNSIVPINEIMIENIPVITKAHIVVDKKRKPEKKINKPKHETKKTIATVQHESNKDISLEKQDMGMQSLFSVGNGSEMQVAEKKSGDGNHIGLYKEKMRRELTRHTYYPDRIKRVNARIDIRVKISENGVIHSPEVIKSSGNRILDKIALGSVEKYQPVGIPPKELGSYVTLSIDFIK